MAKRYLEVSYDDRELAKRLGAKWDPSVRRWYCPEGAPLAKIFKWRAEAKLHADQQSLAHVKTDNSQIPHMNSDIHFKTTSLVPPPARKLQPAINQNFELFMAS